MFDTRSLVPSLHFEPNGNTEGQGALRSDHGSPLYVGGGEVDRSWSRRNDRDRHQSSSSPAPMTTSAVTANVQRHNSVRHKSELPLPVAEQLHPRSAFVCCPSPQSSTSSSSSWPSSSTRFETQSAKKRQQQQPMLPVVVEGHTADEDDDDDDVRMQPPVCKLTKLSPSHQPGSRFAPSSVMSAPPMSSSLISQQPLGDVGVREREHAAALENSNASRQRDRALPWIDSTDQRHAPGSIERRDTLVTSSSSLPTVAAGDIQFSDDDLAASLPVCRHRSRNCDEENNGDGTKIERKREKNKMAARKCRARKLDQILSLQAQCDAFRKKNEELMDKMKSLNSDVYTLSHLIDLHARSGCCIQQQQQQLQCHQQRFR